MTAPIKPLSGNGGIKTTRHHPTGKRDQYFRFRLTEGERAKLNQMSFEQQRSCGDVLRLMIAKG